VCNGWLLSLTARTQYALSTALDLTSPHIGSVVCCGVVWCGRLVGRRVCVMWVENTQHVTVRLLMTGIS